VDKTGTADSPFRIAVAQVSCTSGDITGNLGVHANAMNIAAEHGVSVLVFPELSLTGYEPALAASLAMLPTDSRLSGLKELARRHRIDTVLGAPLETAGQLPGIGAIILTRNGTAMAYRKMHLGANERPFFSPGRSPFVLSTSIYRIGLAICADSSQLSHPATYASGGAQVYASSVFLNAEWYESDVPRLADYARRFSMLTVMANHGGSTGSHKSVVRSAIWKPDGSMLVQANTTENALLIACSVAGVWTGKIIVF